MSNPRKQVWSPIEKQETVAESLPVRECRTQNALPQVQLCIKQTKNKKKEKIYIQNRFNSYTYTIKEKGKEKGEISKPFFVQERRKASGADACKERTKTQKGKRAFWRTQTGSDSEWDLQCQIIIMNNATTPTWRSFSPTRTFSFYVPLSHERCYQKSNGEGHMNIIELNYTCPVLNRLIP